MASRSKKNCFVIMPISTPDHLLNEYEGDVEHFTNVLNNIFVPAIKEIDYIPVSPKSKGSHIIQADIIKKIEDADLVLCDMAALNPNVFFELGIRTALNKPVALVKDDLTEKIPFDTSIINYHTYKAIPTWQVNNEIEKLKKHLLECIESSNGKNTMWAKFGISIAVTETPSNPLEGKVDLLFNKVDSIYRKMDSYSFSSASLASNYPESSSTKKKYSDVDKIPNLIIGLLSKYNLKSKSIKISPHLKEVYLEILGEPSFESIVLQLEIDALLKSLGLDYKVLINSIK